MAAFLVVIEHARSLIFVDFGSLSSPSMLEKAFYFMTGFGHEAVVIFFVLSGFLVGGNAWKRWKENRFAWKRYLADRISRLYTVLFIALLLGGLMDAAGANWFNDFGFYNHSTTQPVAVIGSSFEDQLSVREFFGNLLMFQQIATPTFGSNGPLWSLAHEWWYYMLFPLGLHVFNRNTGTRMFCFLALASLAWLLTSYILILFGVWMLGVIAWWSNGHKWLPWSITIPIFGLAMLQMRLELELFPYSQQFLLGSAFALLLNSYATSNVRLPLSAISKTLAEFSYSLYLVHFPTILLVVSICFAKSGATSRLRFNIASLLLFIMVVCIAFLLSYGVSLFTEARTHKTRSFLYRQFGVSRSS